MGEPPGVVISSSPVLASTIGAGSNHAVSVVKASGSGTQDALARLDKLNASEALRRVQMVALGITIKHCLSNEFIGRYRFRSCHFDQRSTTCCLAAASVLSGKFAAKCRSDERRCSRKIACKQAPIGRATSRRPNPARLVYAANLPDRPLARTT
jgi:hypothetical protein